MKKPNPHSDFELEALEPRILLSAEGADLLNPGLSQVVEVITHTVTEQTTYPENPSLSGNELYSVIEGKDLLVDADGVWDTEGQLLANELTGLMLAADSVVFADGVEAENLLVNAGSIYMGEVQWSGGSVLHSDALTLTGEQSGTGGSTLTLAPRQKDAAISLGVEAEGFSLDSEALDFLSGSGLGELIVGQADGTHVFTIDGLNYTGNLTLRSPELGGHFDVLSQVNHSGGTLTYIGSGHTQNISADTITTGDDISINDSLQLLENPLVTKVHGPNTIYLDTTNGNDPLHLGGANILITGDVLGNLDGSGGTLYLNAGTTGDIRIDGDIGATDPLDGLVIVNARNVVLNGNILLDYFTQQAGEGNTTFGDSASDTLALQGGDLSVITENNVTFNGDVTSTAGNIELTVNAASAGTGKIHFKESVTLDDGDITIHSAKNVEFTKALDMNGDLLQTVGSQTTIFRGEVDADSIRLTANQEIRFLDEVRLAVGDITLTSNDVNFNGGAASIIGALDNSNVPQSDLLVRPIAESVSMDIGSPTGGVGTFQFTTTDIAALADGFSSLTFGYSTGSTNNLRMGNAIFTDPLTVYGGTFLVNGTLNAKASLLLDASVGGINVDNTQIQVGNDQVSNVWQSSQLTLNAHQGDITFTNGASLRILNNDDADLGQGSDINLTATTGSIINAAGSFGFITSRNLTALAAGEITLLTEIKNFTGTSTSAGDITVDELDDLHVLSATTADGAIAMTSGGDTILDLLHSQTDHADNDISVEVFNGSLDVGQVLAGTLGDVLLETEGGLTGFASQLLPHVVGNELTLTAAEGIGQSTVPLQINANVVNAVNSDSGAVVLDQMAGRTDLNASILNDATGAADHIHLNVSGNLEVNATGIHAASDAGVGVLVTGATVVNGDLSTAGGLLSVAGQSTIQLNAATVLNSGGGDVSVMAQAGGITQAVDSAVLSGGGDIAFVAFADILLGSLDARHLLTPADQSTWGNVALITAGALKDTTASSAVNVYANSLDVDTDSGIGELDGVNENGLEIEVNTLAATTNTGDIALKDLSALTLATAAEVDVQFLLADGTVTIFGSSVANAGVANANGDILIRAGGLLTAQAKDAVSDAVATAGAGIVALVAESMSIEGSIRSAGGDISLSGVNNIAMLDAGDLLTSGTGNIAVSSSAGSVLAEADQNIFTGSGSILLAAWNAMTLGTVETTGAVGLRSVNDNILAADGGTDARTVVTGDTLSIDAFGINGPGLSAEKFHSNVNTLSLTGGAGPEFQIENAGTLNIDTTATMVDAYDELLATAALTIVAQSNVDVSGEGNIGIATEGGDLLIADGRIVRTTGAGNIALSSSAAFTMGTGGEVSNENGTIDITAVQTVSVSEVSSLDGDITLRSDNGSIVDSDPAEGPVDISTQGQLSLNAETGVGIESGDRQTLNVLLGTLSAETATGGIFVTSTAGFATNGLISTVAGTPISIISGGDLVVGPNGGGVAVNAGGDLILLADGNLTQLSGSTIVAGTDMRLSSGGAMTLVEVSTPGDVALTALSVIGLPLSTATELTANGLFLDNVGTLGTAAQPLRFEISRLAGAVNNGTLAFENAIDLVLGLVSVETLATAPMGALPVAAHTQSGDRLSVQGIGEGIFAVIDGNLTVDAGAGFALTVAEAIPVLWETTLSQIWNDAFSLAGGDLALRANENLSLTAGGSSATNGGDVSLEVGQDLSFSTTSGINTAAGSLLARVGDRLTLNGAIVSDASVGLIAGTEISVTAIGGPAVRVTAADLILNARVKISTGLLPVTTDVDQLTARSGAGGVYVANQGDVNISNLGFQVPSLNADGTVDVTFSGHQGGVSTDQAGAISVNTTGTLTVQEVAAVIEAFPGTDNAISIVADQAGPEGNQLNVLFDIVDSGLTGNPPTTVYTPETGLLTVTLRKDVSTLQEIIDAINADPDFAGTAVLAEGPLDGSQVFTLGAGEEFAFFAEGGRREGVLVGVSSTFAGGLEPVSAISQILLPGEFYNILFTALNPGDAANAFEVRLLDDGPGGNLPDAADAAFVDWDAGGGKLNIYINYGVTTVGTLLDAVSDAQTNDALPFSAMLDGFTVPSDLDDVLGDASVTLQSNLSATANLRPTGDNNDLQIVSTVAGQLYNQITTEFVDDGSVGSLGVRATFNDVDNLLTVYIQSGVTTANQVMGAINTEGTFSAGLLQENTGGTNTGAGVLQANVFKLHSGAAGVNAVANLIMSGDQNDIKVTRDIPGADENGIEIRLISDASLPIGQATASYDSGDEVLEVRLNSSFATAGNVLSAINAASAGMTATLIPGNSGFGGIVLAAYPETSGGTGGPPEAIFSATGLNNDFELVADSNSPLLENIEVFLIDDGSITDGSATAVYLSGDRHLILNVQSGVTSLNDLLAVLNADAGIPVSGTLVAGNDGTGVFNIPAQPFIGGADPVKARAATELPSGVELILEADDGGVAQNDIQLVFALNPSLVPNTATASFFEVDGVRLLQIQVQSSTTTLDKIDLALTTAGLPFSVENLGAVGSLNAGALALRTAAVQEGSLRLTAGDDVSLIGRVQSETGPVSVTTQNAGNLTFDAATARIYAISKAEINLDGSFANLSSLESPLVKVFGEGLLSILAEENLLESELPVLLESAGDITIGGSGGLSLNDQDLDVQSGGNITLSGPVNAGTGNATLNADSGIEFTVDGSLAGQDLLLTAVEDIDQNGNISAVGTGTVTVTSSNGAITMGADAETSSDSGNISYVANHNVDITSIASTTGNIDVVSGAAITDTHAANGTNLATAGVTTLTAQTGIGAPLTGDLKTQVGDLQLRNLGPSGDIVITEEAAGGDLNITELTQDAISGWSVLNVDNGNLTLSGALSHSDNGSLVLGVNGNLLVQDEINLNGGDLSAGVLGNATFAKDVNSTGGDVGVTASGLISMDPTMTLNADGGNVLLQATGNVLVSHVLSPDADVRIESTAASVLRALNGTDTNITAGTLQLEAALSVGTLLTTDAAVVTEVARLNASAHAGDLAVNEVDALLIGNSSVTVNFAQIDKTTVSGTWNESQLLTLSGAAVIQVGGALTVETIPLSPTVSIDGNFHLNSGDVLTVEGDIEVTNGSAQLVSTLDTLLNGDLDVTGGSLLMQAGGEFTQGANSEITVSDDDAVLRAVGVMTLSRVDTGTGDLALTSDADLLIDAAAPALQVSASGLRLESGGAIGSVANPVNLSADTLSALAVNGIHLDATGDLDVNAVGVTVDTVNLLGATSDPAHVEADLADIESTTAGNILMQVSGALALHDGDADAASVLTNGIGKIFIAANSLDAYADISNHDGAISLLIAAAAHWITTAESAPAAGDGLAAKILSQNGDLQIVVGAALTMDDETVFNTDNGSVRIQTTDDFLVGSVQAANGLAALDVGGSLLDNGDSQTDLVADQLQILSGSGIGVLSPYNAVEIDAHLLAAQTTAGNMVLAELTAVNIGEVSGSVALLDIAGTETATVVAPLYGLQSQGGGSVSMTSAGNLTVLSGGDPADAEYGVSLTGTGNLFLQSSGASAQLILNDSILAGTGHLTLRGNGGMTLAADVRVETAGTGTLTLISGTGGITQVAGGSLISVDGDIVLDAATTISLATVTTDARVAVRSANGAVLDNNAAALNISASTLRMFAGLNIATGLNPLEIEVGTLSAGTLNGAMYFSEADYLNIGSTQALSQVVQADGSLVATTVAAQSGLKTGGASGTIVVQAPAGEINVLAGHTVVASQNGNILLNAFGDLDVDANLSSGTGTVTLQTLSNFELAGGILVSTAGAGQIQVFSNGAVTTEAESRFVAGTGNVAIAAATGVQLGGITTSGKVAVGTLTGSITGAGSTTFDQEVVGSQLLLSALNGGVGTLSPVIPVSAFRTRVGRVAGEAGAGGLNVVNEIGIAVDEVSVSLQQVIADGSLQALPSEVLNDLTTNSNGSIVLRASSGSVVLNGGSDGNGRAVSAHGSGNVRIYAAQNITTHADVESATGHLTLRANGILALNADVTTAAGGTVYLRAETGALTMAGTATVTATNSNLLLQASGNVTLGNLVGNFASVKSVNGQVIKATGSTLNFDGNAFRLESSSDMGSAASPLLISADILSAVSHGGSIYIEGNGNLEIGTVGFAVQEVVNDASTTPVTESNLSGLSTTANNGSVILTSVDGAITVSDAVSAHGSGNVLLNAFTQLMINQDLGSGTGNLSLLAGNGVSLGAAADVTTAGTGSIDADAGTGALIMDASSTFSAPGGSLRLAAAGELQLATLTGNATSLISTGAGIQKVAGTGINVTTTSLRISAGGSVGSAVSTLEISTETLSVASAIGDIFLTESNNVTVTGVAVTTPRVGSDGLTSSVEDAELSDLSTGDNGDIVLVTLAGTITLNDGGDEDFLAVHANGNGSVRLEAPVNLAVNSGVSSESGHITMVAGANLAFGPGVVIISTAAPGTVSLRAGTGAVTMSGLSQAVATNSSLRVRGSVDVTLGMLTADDVSVLSASGSILNAPQTVRNVIANNLRLEAAVGIGTENRHLTTNVGTVSGLAGNGGIFITELNALTIGEVEVTVTEFTASAGTAILTDAAQSDLRASGTGDVLLVTGDTLTLGTVAGDVVNLFSAGAILNNAVSTPNVEANSLLLNAQTDIGSIVVPLSIDVDVFSAVSVSGDITIAAAGDVEVGAVNNLATPGLPGDQQNHVETDTARSAVIGVEGTLTLGRINSGTVGLFAGNQIVKTAASVLNVDATALRIQAVNGVGAAGAYLITRVDTLAGASTTGDILITDNDGLTIGSVTITGLISDVETLAGLTTHVSGDVVILSDDVLTVEDPVSANGNVRLSSEGNLNLGSVAGVDVSLISTTLITHAAGLVTATNLRVHSEGNVASAPAPLKTDVDVLSVVSVSGSVFLIEADDVSLGSVAVTAGGVTDASQHGIEAPGGISLESITGKFLDGGDAEADIRSNAVVAITTLTGLGSTGTGALDVDAAGVSVNSQGNGNVYLDLLDSTDLSGLTMAGHGYLYLNVDGDLTLSAPIALSATGGALLNISGATDLQADIQVGRDLRLSSQSMTMDAGARMISDTGDVRVRVLTTLGMAAAAEIEAVTGSVLVQSGSDMTLGLVTAAIGVDLRAGGNLSGVSIDRATHQITAASVRLFADGVILPVLTDADRLDVNAGAVNEIYELDDLVVGRYGLRLIDEAAGDTLTLRMNEAELTSYNGVAVIPGVGTFVWTSDSALTLGTHLLTDNGDIQITADSLQQSGTLNGAYLDAANGRVTLDMQNGAGTVDSNPVTIQANELTANTNAGAQAYQVDGAVTVPVEGITTTTGAGEIQLVVDNGNLTQAGRILHSGTGLIDLQIADGALDVQATGLGTLPLIMSGGKVQLELDTGITLTGTARLLMQGARFSATTRTGSLKLQLQAASGVQSFLDDFLIQEGNGNIDVYSPHALVLFGSLRNLGTGNFTLGSGTFISMSINSLVRSQSGVLTLSAQELELARIESYGSSTVLTGTVFGIKVKPGYTGTNVFADHTVNAYINTNIVGFILNSPLNVYDVNTNGFLTSFAAGTTINYTAP